MNYRCSLESISWFRDLYVADPPHLKIDPRYQRKPVWVARQKCPLIESILLGLPIPELYIQQTTSSAGESSYVVVDGQQRMRTVLQFIGIDRQADEAENGFPLDKLVSTSPWFNATFEDLSAADRARFYGYKFALRYLETENETELRGMFERLNAFTMPLKPQELRNARYTGPFVRLAEMLANDPYWLDQRIVTPAAVRRMGDIEFVSELLIGVLHGPQAGSARGIDEYYARYEEYDDEFPGQRAATTQFSEALKTVGSIFPVIKEVPRWSNKHDFYTLFVAVAAILRTHHLPKSRTRVAALRQTLVDFAEQVGLRLSDERAGVPDQAVEYVRAIEKGVTDKPRRARRHSVLIGLMQPYFEPREGAHG